MSRGKAESSLGPEPLAIRDEDEPETNNRVSKPEWKMSNRTLLVFITICVLTLMVALDSTSIGVALPVSTIDLHCYTCSADQE